MQSLTHISHYRDHEISVVGFEMLDGWHLAVQIKPTWKPAWPAWRDKQACYQDFEEIKAAGLAWARQAIDERLPALYA
ncbi:hypothetical protein [Herbaspirillum robiniae]|uniref:Uncharacterized protein n=1 Tax=Herbaspirillum robiniae TaxID=2014887 RepID=A0A246WML2_9BURK|nr:hypothetical protein [Herbaspirillum robiniae]NUU02355.1 hypothetical protein [Herbaspirillum robiniae]OWY27601.1 hypothetical protein CEJ42_18750 [Herbaspirillum robiniae]